MDKAKAAVSDFMSKAGHHDTTVHETVAPAVTHETVNRQRHEEVTTAIDKEVHQDHHHTSVQPVYDREVLPETHTHNLGPVEHREHRHGNDRDVAARLEQERAQFADQRVQGKARETQSVAPVVAGEHVHHHVHETIQPVVNKETIQPNVVHTTVPIHEVHHNEAQHHSTSALPAVSLADFKKQGGVLTGREERYDGFEGEPRSVGGALSNETQGHHGHHGHHGTTGTTGTTGAGNSYDAGTSGQGTGLTGEPGLRSNTSGTTSGVGTGTTGRTKPSMMEKVDPRVDADGDGKRGFMK